MKQYLLFSCLSFFLLLFTACSEETSENDSPATTIVEGSIVGSGEGTVELLDRKGCFTYLDSILAKDSLEKGLFRMRFQKKQLGYLRLEFPSDGIMLYLSAGDSLVVHRDAKANYRFEGKGSIPNQYLRNKKHFKDSMDRVQDTIFQAGKVDFLNALEERRKACRSFRRTYFEKRKDGSGDYFQKLERSRDKVATAVMRFSYPDIYRYEHPNDSIEFTSSYWSFLDSIDMNDPLMLQVPEYLSFAYDVANKYTLDNKSEKKSMGYLEMLFETIVDEFDGKVKEALLTYFILEQLRYGEKGVKKALMERYRDQVEDSFMKRTVERKIRNKGGRPSF